MRNAALACVLNLNLPLVLPTRKSSKDLRSSGGGSLERELDAQWKLVADNGQFNFLAYLPGPEGTFDVEPICHRPICYEENGVSCPQARGGSRACFRHSVHSHPLAGKPFLAERLDALQPMMQAGNVVSTKFPAEYALGCFRLESKRYPLSTFA